MLYLHINDHVWVNLGQGEIVHVWNGEITQVKNNPVYSIDTF